MKRCFFFFLLPYHITHGKIKRIATVSLRILDSPAPFSRETNRETNFQIEYPEQSKRNQFFHVRWLLFLALERCIKTRRKSRKRKRRKKKSVAERKEAKIQRRRPTSGGDLWWDYRWRYFFITVSPLLFSLLLASLPTTTGWWR